MILFIMRIYFEDYRISSNSLKRFTKQNYLIFFLYTFAVVEISFNDVLFTYGLRFIRQYSTFFSSLFTESLIP